MDKFARYVNADNELFILLNRWSRVNIDKGKVSTIPTTIDLLEVGKEKLVTVKGEPLSAVEFERIIKSGLLRKIK